MTFKEAVAHMETRAELGFRCVEYQVKFHDSGTVNNCQLYTERFGGVVIIAKNWEEAFILLNARVCPDSGVDDGQAPTEDIIPPPAPAKEESDVPS